MRLRLYIILQIFTFNKIKKKKKAISTNEIKENVQRSFTYTTLAESTVITAIAHLYCKYILCSNSSESNL